MVALLTIDPPKPIQQTLDLWPPTRQQARKISAKPATTRTKAAHPELDLGMSAKLVDYRTITNAAMPIDLKLATEAQQLDQLRSVHTNSLSTAARKARKASNLLDPVAVSVPPSATPLFAALVTLTASWGDQDSSFDVGCRFAQLTRWCEHHHIYIAPLTTPDPHTDGITIHDRVSAVVGVNINQSICGQIATVITGIAHLALGHSVIFNTALNPDDYIGARTNVIDWVAAFTGELLATPAACGHTQWEALHDDARTVPAAVAIATTIQISPVVFCWQLYQANRLSKGQWQQFPSLVEPAATSPDGRFPDLLQRLHPLHAEVTARVIVGAISPEDGFPALSISTNRELDALEAFYRGWE